MRGSVVVEDSDDGQPGGILPAGFFGFVGLAVTVGENGQGLPCQSQQNILEVINLIGTTDATDLPSYSSRRSA